MSGRQFLGLVSMVLVTVAGTTFLIYALLQRRFGVEELGQVVVTTTSVSLALRLVQRRKMYRG